MMVIYGIEIWIDLTTPYAWSKQNKPRCFTKAHFQCVHHDPRRMLVRSDAPDMSFWLLALHAPHSGHSLQTRQAWWEETSELMRQHYDGDVLFVLGDTNAAPGNRDGTTVLQDGFSTSTSTGLLKQFLAEFKLYLPATSAVHQGPNGTWTDFTGDRMHCIDHVAVPQVWQHRCTWSSILQDFDLATIHDDHQVAAVQLQWSERVRCCGEPRPGRPQHKAGTYHHAPGLSDQICPTSSTTMDS